MRVHFTGIKGVGMTALALAYQDLGWEIQGSDTSKAQITDKPLKNRKIPVYSRFTPRNISKIENSKWKPIIDKLIYTGAHHGFHNVEVQWARSRNIPIINYAQALADFFKDKKQICVCGVGGKTTTSAMTATILEHCGLNPSWIIGTSDIVSLPASGHWDQKGEWVIIESDEYWADPLSDKKSKFDYLTPQIIICTNLQHDHPDAFPTEKDFVLNYLNFFSKLPASGLLIISQEAKNKVDEYDLKFWKKIKNKGILVQIYGNEKNLKRISHLIKIPGIYNLKNGQAAAAAALHLNIPEDCIHQALASYQGAKRRFEFYGEFNGIKIYDDYAHHPLQISALIQASREFLPPKTKLRIIFHPHTFSRTKALFTDFAKVLSPADEVIMMPIFASAREKLDPRVNSQKLASEINKQGGNSIFISDNQKLISYLTKTSQKGDAIFTVGAGDIYKIIPDLINKLK